MGFNKWLAGITFSAIFIFAILMYSSQFAVDNNSAITIDSDSDYAILNSNLQSDLGGVVTDVNSSSSSFYENPVVTGENAVQSGGQFSVGVGTMMSLVTNSIGAAYKKIFGNDPYFGIIVSALGAIILFIILAYAYKAIRGGDVD
jgi:hypothetical protein